MSLYLSYSHTPLILPSFSKEEANRVSTGWVPAATPWEEIQIKQLLTTTSIAPGIFKTGHKAIKNFQFYQHIMLDFDSPDNVPTKNMVDILKLRYPEVAWAVFTSVKHGLAYNLNNVTIPGHDKYRVLFPINRALSKKEVDELNTYFLEHYPKIDNSTFMLARYFFKGNDKIWHFNVGKQYLDVNAILAEAVTLRKSKKIKTYLSNNMTLTTTDGDEMPISSITTKTIIHCPYHVDEEPSAFVDITPHGHKMLHCSSCKSRGEGTDSKGTYYFKNPAILAQKVTLFWSESAHSACYIDQEEGIIKTLKPGSDWLNYCVQNNIPAEEQYALKRAEITYDPGKPHGFLEMEAKYNTYKPSEFIKDYPTKIKNDAQAFKKTAPYSYDILQNLTGKDEYTEYLLNWLGYLLQTGKRVNTAILFQNTKQGIGKDLIFSHVWTPIFGKFNCVDESGGAIGERFTFQYAHARLIRFDECFAVQDYNENVRRLQWLKNRITANFHQIEAKGRDKISIPHFGAYILHSNYMMSVPIDKGDRRFVVIENNKAKDIKLFPWYVGKTDLEFKVDSEVPTIAEYLQSIDIDEELANTAIFTSAKERLQEASQDELTAFAEALKKGNSDYFEIEDALNNAKLDPLLVKTATAFITDFIENYNAIPSTYINALLKNKVSMNSMSLAKRFLASHKVSNHTPNEPHFKIFKDGKQHRVYKYLED